MSNALNVGGIPASLEQAFAAPAAPSTAVYWGGPTSLQFAAAAPAYTLGADPGAVAVTGTPAGLLVGRRLSAAAGSVAWTGTAATLGIAVTLAAEPGALMLTGAAADLAGPPTPAAVPSSAGAGRIVTGSVPIEDLVRRLHIAQLRHRALAAEPGALQLTGQPAALARHATVRATTGSVRVARRAVGFVIVDTIAQARREDEAWLEELLGLEPSEDLEWSVR